MTSWHFYVMMMAVAYLQLLFNSWKSNWMGFDKRVDETSVKNNVYSKPYLAGKSLAS